MTMTTEYGYGKLERVDISLDEAEIRSACMAYIRAHSKNAIVKKPPTRTEMYEKEVKDHTFATVFEVRWELATIEDAVSHEGTE